MVYDGNEIYPMEEEITYQNDLVAGNAHEPIVLHPIMKEDILLFPNPVKAGETIRIELPHDMRDVTIEVIDAMGRTLYHEPSEGSCTLPTPNLPGVYTVRIIDHSELTKQIIVIIK